MHIRFGAKVKCCVCQGFISQLVKGNKPFLIIRSKNYTPKKKENAYTI